MIAPVDPYLEAFAKAGADIISVHAEAGPHLHRTLQAIRALGKKAGVVLNPATPANVIEHVLDRIDLVLLMTRQPRLRRPGLHPGSRDKVRQVAEMIGDRAIDIEIDGGVTPETAPLLAAAGAERARRGLGGVQGRPRRLRGEHPGDPRCGRPGEWRAGLAAIRHREERSDAATQESGLTPPPSPTPGSWVASLRSQ